MTSNFISDLFFGTIQTFCKLFKIAGYFSLLIIVLTFIDGFRVLKRFLYCFILDCW